MHIQTEVINKKIETFETQTGTELIVCVVKISDPYPGAYWRGGVVIGSALGMLFDHYYHLSSMELCLLTQLLFVLGTTFILKQTGFFQFFLLPKETERESREKALSLFSGFQTQLKEQNSIMLFLSLTERKIHLLVDENIKEFLSEEDLIKAVEHLSTAFKGKKFDQGIEGLITELQSILMAKIPADKRKSSGGNALENRIYYF